MTTTELAAEIRSVFMSLEFKRDLEESSSYLASIAQERPIIFFFAKQLRRRNHKFTLEDERRDLFIDGKSVEFKFAYDWGMTTLEKELQILGNNLENGVNRAKKGDWGVLDRVFKDVCSKKSDIFVWIICSRDLRNIHDNDLKYINCATEQRKYNKKYLYNNPDFVNVADRCLSFLQLLRPFAVVKEEVVTVGEFPSAYHVRICNFSGAERL